VAPEVDAQGQVKLQDANALELEASVPSDVLHVISWSFKV
jgi:hypothetical protein